MNVTVEQGSVHVNAVYLVVETPDFFLLEADLRAKRAEVHDILDDGVELCAGADTVGAEGESRPTSIRIEMLPGFALDATVTRYTLRIYGRRSEARVGTLLWSARS